MKIPRIGDVIRCRRCRTCVEITHAAPVDKDGTLYMLAERTSSHGVADSAVDWCGQCATDDEKLGLQITMNATATGTARN